MSRRTARVAEEVRGEIARILRAEAMDDRLAGVTLTRVEVSPDLGSARVFWSHLRAEEPGVLERVGPALEHAAGFVRRRLASRLQLRRTPELHFRHDPSLVAGSRMLSLLDGMGGDSEREEPPEGPLPDRGER